VVGFEVSDYLGVRGLTPFASNFMPYLISFLSGFFKSEQELFKYGVEEIKGYGTHLFIMDLQGQGNRLQDVEGDIVFKELESERSIDSSLSKYLKHFLL